MSKDKEYDDYCIKAGIPNRNKAYNPAQQQDAYNPYQALQQDAHQPIKHKHAALIHAWADGAEIEIRRSADAPWEKTEAPKWYSEFEYRIKPEPKPDIVRGFEVTKDGTVWLSLSTANIRLTFDGETGELKLAEVL